MTIAIPLFSGFAGFPALLEERNAGPDLTRYLLVCGGLLLGILAVAYLFRRFFTGTMRRHAAKRSLRVLDVLPLGGKQKLVVVRCYDRSFLLGLGEKELSSIAELDVEDVPATEPAASANVAPPATVFRDALAGEVGEEPVLPEPQAPWNREEGVLA